MEKMIASAPQILVVNALTAAGGNIASTNPNTPYYKIHLDFPIGLCITTIRF
jgi:hypothetical protein